MREHTPTDYCGSLAANVFATTKELHTLGEALDFLRELGNARAGAIEAMEALENAARSEELEKARKLKRLQRMIQATLNHLEVEACNAPADYPLDYNPYDLDENYTSEELDAASEELSAEAVTEAPLNWRDELAALDRLEDHSPDWARLDVAYRDKLMKAASEELGDGPELDWVLQKIENRYQWSLELTEMNAERKRQHAASEELEELDRSGELEQHLNDDLAPETATHWKRPEKYMTPQGVGRRMYSQVEVEEPCDERHIVQEISRRRTEPTDLVTPEQAKEVLKPDAKELNRALDLLKEPADAAYQQELVERAKTAQQDMNMHIRDALAEGRKIKPSHTVHDCWCDDGPARTLPERYAAHFGAIEQQIEAGELTLQEVAQSREDYYKPEPINRVDLDAWLLARILEAGSLTEYDRIVLRELTRGRTGELDLMLPAIMDQLGGIESIFCQSPLRYVAEDFSVITTADLVISVKDGHTCVLKNWYRRIPTAPMTGKPDAVYAYYRGSGWRELIPWSELPPAISSEDLTDSKSVVE
jgi:hypothetical protein